MKISDPLNEEQLAQLLNRKPFIAKSKNSGFKNKTVLVTGAGGTIGHALSIEIFKNNAKALILVEHSEYALYKLYESLIGLKKISNNISTIIIPRLASVLDEKEMFYIFNKFKPEIIYHAAAYKHVHMVEINSRVGVRNNVLGTYVTAKLANDFGANKYVLISSDKAIKPVSKMGYSKLLSENIISDLAGRSKTKFCIVRFGNILGSSGSVLPKLINQLRAKVPMTISSPKSKRYFMLKSEAIHLLMQIINMSDMNGTIYCFDMGKPIYILDLAKKLQGLFMGYIDEPEIEFTELEPYKKISEASILTKNAQRTANPKIYKIQPKKLSIKSIEKILLAIDSLN